MDAYNINIGQNALNYYFFSRYNVHKLNNFWSNLENIDLHNGISLHSINYFLYIWLWFRCRYKETASLDGHIFALVPL